jgi:hypothetical protein
VLLVKLGAREPHAAFLVAVLPLVCHGSAAPPWGGGLWGPGNSH